MIEEKKIKRTKCFKKNHKKKACGREGL